MTTARERDIKLLVAKFVKLVESLNPGERLSLRKIAAKKSTRAGNKGKVAAKSAATKTTKIKQPKRRQVS